MSYTAAVITISDKASVGERVDTSGPSVRTILENNGLEVVYTSVIPDDFEKIKAELIKCSDEFGIALVLTTGGTGFSPRDITPEATMAVVETPNVDRRIITKIMYKTTVTTDVIKEEAALSNLRLLIVVFLTFVCTIFIMIRPNTKKTKQ